MTAQQFGSVATRQVGGQVAGGWVGGWVGDYKTSRRADIPHHVWRSGDLVTGMYSVLSSLC